MRKVFMSCALWALASAAGAQPAADPQATSPQQDKHPAWTTTAIPGRADEALRHGPQTALIETSAERASRAQVADSSVGRRKDAPPEREHRRRTGAAMLIAALAVMTTIALRRLGGTES